MLVYLLIINILSFFLFGFDKYYAKHNMFRISEKNLLFVTFIGGVIGSIFGMYIFRHKTTKYKFKIFNFICLVLWIFIIYKKFL